MCAAKRSAVAGRCGGESKISKVFRDGFPPSKSNASSLGWSARDRGVLEGGKTSANLAATVEVLLTLGGAFCRQACVNSYAGQQATGVPLCRCESMRPAQAVS